MRHKNDKPRGFTLIELLIVISILGLLIGIALPSLNAAKDAARRASTRATIHTLDSGLEMFRSDEVLGRYYPPSYWNATNPYGANDPCYGAQTLVWAVCGPLLDGTRGFEPRGGDDLHDVYHSSKDNYPLRGPFVEPGKLTIVKPTDDQCEIASALASGPIYDASPVILDNFNMPILYYKATNNAFQPGHNQPIAEVAQAPVDQGADYWLSEEGDYGGRGFRGFITDPRLDALGGAAGPHRRDSFILISAGIDRKYGSSDDVLNFSRD